MRLCARIARVGCLQPIPLTAVCSHTLRIVMSSTSLLPSLPLPVSLAVSAVQCSAVRASRSAAARAHLACSLNAAGTSYDDWCAALPEAQSTHRGPPSARTTSS